MTLRIKPSSRISFSTPVTLLFLSTSNNSLSVDFRMTAANNKGARIPAILLQSPIMLIRRAADSIGPSMVT